jgi:carboxymethylenebutenolidase
MVQPAIVKEKVELFVADGTRMAAYTARPEEARPEKPCPGEVRPEEARPDDAARHPGLLLFQEAFGVNHHIRSVADRFAAAGYVVIAPEMFHRTAPPGFEASYTDFPAVMPHLQAMTPETMEMDIRSSYDWLGSNANADPNRISSVGFCMGGRASYLANSVVALIAAVSFYGGGIAPTVLDRAPRQQAPLLLIWGGPGQAHHAPAPQSRDRCLERRAKELCERRVFSSRPRIFLR